jgi:hypothetical protein
VETDKQFERFDCKINSYLTNKNWEPLANYLVTILEDFNNISEGRKYTIRNILLSNLAVFKHVFLTLNREENVFWGVEKYKNAIPSQTHKQLTSLFHDKLNNAFFNFTRIDGRRRFFLEKTAFNEEETDLFDNIIKLIPHKNKEATLEKVLFEKISPIDLGNINTSFWHIDSLTDQLKIVIPITQIHSQNAPMKYVGGIKKLEDYDNQIWQKLHTIYKISNLNVSEANYFEDQTIESKNIHLTTAQVGDLILFNPQVIHTGSICHLDTRDTITLYCDQNTHRNKCLQQIK